MKMSSCVAMLTTVFAMGSMPAQVGATRSQEKVTLVGCAVRGDGDGDGFLLANSEQGPSRMLYWLDDDDDEVKKLMGQLVEVTGEVEGDVKRGEIEIERENGMIELEIKAGGRKATVKLADVPSAVGAPNAAKDREQELPYLVRKLDVQSARAVAPTCR